MLESCWQTNFTIHRLTINVSVLLDRTPAWNGLSPSFHDLNGTFLTLSQNEILYDVHIMGEYNMEHLHYHYIEVLGELHNKDENVFIVNSKICRVCGSTDLYFEVFAISISNFIAWLFPDCKSSYFQRMVLEMLENCLFSRNSADLLFFSFQSDSFQMYLSK